VHQNWDPERFGAALRKVQEITGLRQQDIARMAGRSRPQVSRWLTGAHRPDYDSLRQLADSLRGYPGLDDLPARLMEAAGYDGPAVPPAAASPRYSDPDLQSIWELTRLPENVRLGMIALARGMREAAEHENGEERPA
jgi:transcriptional regulator with XRE-family HTH domain